MQDLLAFLIVSVVVVAAAFVVQRRIGGRLGQLLFLGLCLRIIGSTLRLEVIERAYGGGSDAKNYMYYGKLYAERIADFDLSFFLGDDQLADSRWWGTQFVRNVTAVVIFFIGDNIRAAFLIFSCFSFLGLYFIIEAFGNACGRDHRSEYARWALFWPSLWFWPSSVGKEALLTLGLGLFIWGYVGRRGTMEWRALLGGLFIAFAIRPHVAMIFALSLAVAEFLRQGPRGTRGKLVTGLAVAVLLAISVRTGLSQLGLADADLEGIEEFFEHRSFSTEQGGSRIYRARGPLAIPVAFMNVFLRPFPWEATGIQILSGAEIWFFWGMLFSYRRGLGAVKRIWRTNRFTVLAAPLGMSLAMLYGLAFANLGIIARQRVLVLPFVVSLLALTRIYGPRPAPREEPANGRLRVRDGPQRSLIR